MDHIASRGFDVYLLDLRGYGRSSRPKEMSEPADRNGPIVTTEVAPRDVGAVVDHILQKRGIAKVNLIGWSWGTSIMASYAAENPGKVERLVLYAPQGVRTTPSLVQVQGKLGAYRTVQRSAARDRWLNGVPEEKKASLIPPGWFEAWADATFASDPEGAKMDPPVLRAPNGVVQDGNEYWAKGNPLYDPAKITAPTLLAVGEWDRDTPPYMAHALFPLLINAPAKRFVMFGEGTAHHHHGEEQDAALQRSAAVPGGEAERGAELRGEAGSTGPGQAPSSARRKSRRSRQARRLSIGWRRR